jgi:hypothetical protein
MSKGNRPTVCSVSGRRLRAKSWFYRDGKYFYNKKVWENERGKLAAEKEKAKADAAKSKAEAAEKAKAEAAKPAEPAEAKPADGSEKGGAPDAS